MDATTSARVSDVVAGSRLINRGLRALAHLSHEAHAAAPYVRPAARAKARRTPVDADDDAALAVWQPGQQQIALKAWDEGEA